MALTLNLMFSTQIVYGQTVIRLLQATNNSVSIAEGTNQSHQVGTRFLKCFIPEGDTIRPVNPLQTTSSKLFLQSRKSGLVELLL